MGLCSNHFESIWDSFWGRPLESADGGWGASQMRDPPSLHAAFDGGTPQKKATGLFMVISNSTHPKKDLGHRPLLATRFPKTSSHHLLPERNFSYEVCDHKKPWQTLRCSTIKSRGRPPSPKSMFFFKGAPIFPTP